MHKRFPVHLMSALVALPMLAMPAYAAGDGSSGASAPSCAKGEVYDDAQKKCVAPKEGMLKDDNIYEQGRTLAMAGRYDEAIAVLSLAADKTDPRILNYLGYSHRKSGRVVVGLGYYEEALRNDPGYTLVREYMGEAHLQLGNLAAAREQLDQIEKRAGKGSREYGMLSEQIDRFMRS